MSFKDMHGAFVAYYLPMTGWRSASRRFWCQFRLTSLGVTFSLISSALARSDKTTNVALVTWRLSIGSRLLSDADLLLPYHGAQRKRQGSASCHSKRRTCSLHRLPMRWARERRWHLCVAIAFRCLQLGLEEKQTASEVGSSQVGVSE